MTKIRNILFASLAAVFLSSCGEQYKAKQLVSNFLDRSLAEKDFSIENCSKLDSTYYITDSTLNAMRAASRKAVKKVAFYPHRLYKQRSKAHPNILYGRPIATRCSLQEQLNADSQTVSYESVSFPTLYD